MPEGPELYLASKFINTVCSNRIFGGGIVKSEVSKQNIIEWKCNAYKISSKSRGKEVMLNLTEVLNDDIKSNTPRSTSLLFHFGMSGVFNLTPASSIPKHSHLRFFTVNEDPQMALNFVDVRRFGSWTETQEWSADRGPDPVSEYQPFRENVLSHLSDPAFKKPICEVLLNQRFFNGIGNYLRAEILYRAGIRPFDEARSVLEHLPLCTESQVKRENPDILQLCNLVPTEVIALDVAGSYDPSASKEEIRPFLEWLQCYDKPEMKKLRDHNKRTIWFTGEPGSLAPKNTLKSSPKKKKKEKGLEDKIKSEDTENALSATAKCKKEEPAAPTSRRITRSRVKT